MSPPQATELELMRRVQANDPDAFRMLYDRLAPGAMRIAQAVCGDRHRAEDAVQDAFLSVWRARHAYRAERGAVQPWVLGVVRNRAIDSLRRNQRHDRARLSHDGVLDHLPARDGVEADAVARDQARQLRVTLAELPALQREVIALAFFGELSHREIARGLVVPLGTVKGRMRLGLEKLRDQVAA